MKKKEKRLTYKRVVEAVKIMLAVNKKHEKCANYILTPNGFVCECEYEKT